MTSINWAAFNRCLLSVTSLSLKVVDYTALTVSGLTSKAHKFLDKKLQQNRPHTGSVKKSAASESKAGRNEDRFTIINSADAESEFSPPGGEAAGKYRAGEDVINFAHRPPTSLMPITATLTTCAT